MMRSLRFRLTLTYLAVILVGMSLAALLAWLAVEQLYLETQKANLLAQAQLVATALQNETLAPAAPGAYSQMSNVLPGIHTRLISEQGAVIIDLQSSAPAGPESGLVLPALAQGDSQPVSPAELLSRPEIARALSGQASAAVRRLATLPGNPRILYVAAPVKTTTDQVAQVVYIASPLPNTGLAALPAVIRRQLLGAVALAIVLATAMGWWLARRISQPLMHLAQAANAVAGGDLNQVVPEDTAIADLRDLGRSFNIMTASLRRADQLKTAFVADASHELRTPLTALKGFVETLQDGAIDDLEVRDGFLASIAAETERLIRLVNELLLLSRADAQALNLRLQAFDLPDLARTRAGYLTPLANRRQVSLQVIEPAAAPVPPVLADPDRVAQVLDNLLENAIRHSRPGQAVTITIRPAEDEVSCAIADTGSGIPAHHLPFIFERFYRAEAARSRRSGNSGLGLAIAQALVLAQRGQIAVQSQEGQGTTIRFTLPVYQDCP